MKHVFLAGLFHETHMFLDERTGLADFEIIRGEKMFERKGDSSALGGALEVFADHSWEVTPSVIYNAMPSGLVEDAVFEGFWNDVKTAWNPDVDAIFLILHGAMATESIDDAEGEFLTRIRQQLPGAAELPIFGVYDLHANFSQDMASGADALIAYRENPHTDAKEATIRAAELLVNSTERPSMVYRSAEIVWPPTAVGTADEPMAGLEALARKMEAENDFVLAANVNAGFAYADSPHTGVSFQIVTTDGERAEQLLDQFVAAAREADKKVEDLEQPFPEALAEIQANPISGLTALVEPSDNIGGGAPGDCTGLMREVLAAGLTNAAVCLNDPDAVKKLDDCEPGDRLTLELGGKGSRFDPGPVELEVEFVSRSDGRFRLEDPHSHLASMKGDNIEMGPSAVVRHGELTILLTSDKTPPFDLGQWRSQGVNPEELDFIIVKAAVAHRQAYNPITARSFWIDTPGPCRADNSKRV